MKNKITSAFAVIALATATALTVPTAANAAPACTTTAGASVCTGTTSDGASYTFTIPGNFNGTFFLYSHGFRSNVALPAALGGPVNMNPQTGPTTEIANALVGFGYGVGGSGFSRQGWNLDEAVKTNAELIGQIKTTFPKVKRVVVWGDSLGGIISQGVAELYPGLVDAVGPMCAVAEGPVAIGTYFDDILFGFKAFFDPTIKGGNYSAGAAGVGQALGDLQKMAAALTYIKDNITGPAATSWPTTASPAGKSLAAAGVPARSALLLVGLLAGVPTQSAHFDGLTGPGDPTDPANTSYYSFVWAIQPALAVLENIGSHVGQAILGRLDAEAKVGGNGLDNTTVDYAERLGDLRDTYIIPLSGDGAVDNLLKVLAASAPLRSKADPAAAAKVNALMKTTGKVSKPTIAMSTVIDPFVTAGNTQWYADQYEKQYQSEQAKLKAKAKKAKKKYVPSARKFVALYTQPTVDRWTKFTLAGVDTSAPGPYGTTHCGFSTTQYVTVALMLADAASRGSLPSYLSTVTKESDGFVTDPLFETPLPFFFRK